MATFDTNALTLETADATASLPDPTTVTGRTHWLSNTGTATVTWSSIGATPFTVDGANVASLSIPAGRSRQLQSDGVHWVVAPTASRRIFAATGVTDGAGNITFNFSPAFAATPVITHAIQTSSTNLFDARITALSASSVTFNVRGSAVVVVLGISVLQAPAAASGVTIHCEAIEAGQGV